MLNSNDEETNKGELPRPGSVMYNFHYKDVKSKKKTLKKWQKLNKFLMLPLYRIKLLPLLGLGKIFLILITKGWKTGKKRRTPLEYRNYEGNIVIFAARGENATWVKNLRAYPEFVSVILGFHQFKPKIDSVSDLQQKINILNWYITKFGKAAKTLFGWNPKEDNLEKTDLSRLAGLTTIFILKR